MKELIQIELYSNILFSTYNFNSDARSMTRNSLKNILKKIYLSLSNPIYNTTTKSHLEFSAEKIEAILSAQIQIN